MTKKEWKELTSDQRDRVCVNQRLTMAFIKGIWKELTEYQRYRVCVNQRLTMAFIKGIWKELTADQRDRVCENQRLTMAFIKGIWKELTEYRLDLLKKMKLPNPEEAAKRAKEYAKEHNLKIKGQVLLAFRTHDKFGRGAYKKAFFYQTGRFYRDWHCDPRAEVANSFGFGIWPKGNTPVAVPIKDFMVAVNRNDGKARVLAFRVISHARKTNHKGA